MRKLVNRVTFFMEASSSELPAFVFFTSSTIREVKHSSGAHSARARHRPAMTLLPESTLSPGSFTTGSDSPVRMDSLTSRRPSCKVQSVQRALPAVSTRTSPF